MGILKKKGESGAATNFISRNQALKKLQLTLAAFRRICILKGVYPREPRNKKKAGKGSTAPKTYYYRKDIQYLLHEPLVQKFREYKIYQNKLKKAIAKKEWAVAKSIEANQKPEFRLDHIIKERYPTFIDAIRDLDDALSMAFLFSTLASHDKIPSKKVKECQRLSSEFQAYIASTSSLRKVFISIKGVYYQADIRGQEVSWIVPHQFTQDVPVDVDFKIMATFLDLYISLIGFVNYKLYTDANYVYPPKLDTKLDGHGAGLSAYLLEVSSDNVLDNVKEMGTNESDDDEKMSKKKAKQLQKLALSNLSEKLDSLANAQPEEEADTQVACSTLHEQPSIGINATAEDSDSVPTLMDLTTYTNSLKSFQTLFNGCTFWLSREVPYYSLVFVIRAFGGSVSTEHHPTFPLSDPRITHHIIDRPLPADSSRPEWMSFDGRDYIQPQWIYDCVNARKILTTKGYHAGEILPPHLSPFETYEEGDYVPEGVSAVAVSKGMVGEVEVLDVADVIIPSESSTGVVAKNDDDDDDKAESDHDEDEVSSDEEMYQEELKAEAAGLTYSEYMQMKDEKSKATDLSKKRKTEDIIDTLKPGSKKIKKTKARREVEAVAEKKELAKMMMSKKDKRLYDQIQFGKDKKKVQVDALVAKRDKAKKKGFKVTEE